MAAVSGAPSILDDGEGKGEDEEVNEVKLSEVQGKNGKDDEEAEDVVSSHWINVACLGISQHNLSILLPNN